MHHRMGLVHIMENGEEKPITYTSCTLTAADKKLYTNWYRSCGNKRRKEVSLDAVRSTFHHRDRLQTILKAIGGNESNITIIPWTESEMSTDIVSIWIHSAIQERMWHLKRWFLLLNTVERDVFNIRVNPGKKYSGWTIYQTHHRWMQEAYSSQDTACHTQKWNNNARGLSVMGTTGHHSWVRQKKIEKIHGMHSGVCRMKALVRN